MKVHEKRSHTHASDEEKKVNTRKHKAEAEQEPKKQKIDEGGGDDNGQATNANSHVADVAAEFEKFCRATREHLSIKQMREILEANVRDSSIADEAVVPRWFVKLIICSKVFLFVNNMLSFKCFNLYMHWYRLITVILVKSLTLSAAC